MYVTLKTFLLDGYDMDGTLDELIKTLEAVREDAKAQGLKNVRVDCDWEYAEHGPGQHWQINIIGDKE